jgi:antitoxin HicB
MRQHPKTRQYDYTAVFAPAKEGGFVVTFPALPGVITEGDTLEHARVMATEALQGFQESLAKDGLSSARRRSSSQSDN